MHLGNKTLAGFLTIGYRHKPDTAKDSHANTETTQTAGHSANKSLKTAKTEST